MQLAIYMIDLSGSGQEIDDLLDNGVKHIEVWPSFFMEQNEKIVGPTVARYQSAGINFCSCHAPFADCNDISNMCEEKRKQAVKNHLKAIARANPINTKCLVIHPGHGQTSKEDLGKRMELLCRSLEILLPEAEKFGIKLALENMPPDYPGSHSKDILKIMEKFASPFLGVCLDTGHAHLTDEGLMKTFKNLRKHIISFHLQDNDRNRDGHLQPPHGSIDWKAFAREFNSMNFPHPAVVEAMPWNRGTWSMLLKEVQELFSGSLNW